METPRAEQVTEEIQTGEIVMAYLDRTRELWLPDYRRAERDGRMNAELNAAADRHIPKLDQLLDELNAIGYFAIANA